MPSEVKYEEALAAVNRAHESDALMEFMESLTCASVERFAGGWWISDGARSLVVVGPTFREALVALRERLEGGK